MKEHKFRVWHLWGEGFSILTLDELCKKPQKYHSTYYKDSIERFTGLIDDKGIEVYKNDIVELDLNNLGVKRCIVKWHKHHASWYFDNPKQNYFMEDIAYIQEHIKVVGNIHQ